MLIAELYTYTTNRNAYKAVFILLEIAHEIQVMAISFNCTSNEEKLSRRIKIR